MTKPTTAEALKIAINALARIRLHSPNDDINLIAKEALAATADVQDHIPEAEKMIELTDDEILNIAEDVGISNYVAYRLSKEFARAVLAAQVKKAREL